MSHKGPILITGGAGCIGSHCRKAVAEAGFLPIGYDSLSTGHKAFVRWGPLIVANVQDSSKIASVIRQHGAGGHALRRF
jgi:UDP-glucose 4-epimerase/UDP-arabinose 4-epimerase